MHSFTTLTCALTLLGVTACGGSGMDPTPVGPGPGTLTMTVAPVQLVPGLTTQLTWVVKDDQGQVVTDVPVTFTVTPAGIVAVAGDGTVSAIAPGLATISGKAGKATGQAQVSVQEGGVVGPAGASLTGLAGAVELVVPAGATPDQVVVTFAQSVNPLLDPSADGAVAYDIGTGNRTFAIPATLRLRFNPQLGPYGLPPEQHRIRQYAASAWVGIPNGAADPSNVASGSITTGGLFSVGWAEPSTPCTAPEYRQFDFWLGAWSITANGQPNGLSDITATPGGCAILEHYRTLGTGVGRSINFYQPATGLWYQTYIDNQNSRAIIAGTAQGQTMTLLTPSAGVVVDRWQWTLEPGGIVRQTSARSTDGGQTYGPFSWNGVYSPR